MTHFSNAERKEESDFDKPVGTSNHLYSYRLHRVHRLPLRRWPALAPYPDELGIGVHEVVQLEAAVQLGLDLARRRSLALRLLLAAWNNAPRRWRPWLRGNEEGRGLPARHALTPATTIDAEFHGTFRGVSAPVLTRRTRCSALCCETFGRVSGCASWDTARHGTGGAGQGAGACPYIFGQADAWRGGFGATAHGGPPAGELDVDCREWVTRRAVLYWMLTIAWRRRLCLEHSAQTPPARQQCGRQLLLRCPVRQAVPP